MPLIQALARQQFSEAGPRPQALNVGTNFAVMLLCLQRGQELRAPEGDTAETIFSVLAGEGVIVEGDTRHEVRVGDVVHISPGTGKVLIAGRGTFTVLGVRQLKGKRHA